MRNEYLFVKEETRGPLITNLGARDAENYRTWSDVTFSVLWLDCIQVLLGSSASRAAAHARHQGRSPSERASSGGFYFQQCCIQQTLNHFGFGNKFINVIGMFCNDQGTCSRFGINRGMRPGCASSPLLFLMFLSIKYSDTEGINIMDNN